MGDGWHGGKVGKPCARLIRRTQAPLLSALAAYQTREQEAEAAGDEDAEDDFLDSHWRSCNDSGDSHQGSQAQGQGAED